MLKTTLPSFNKQLGSEAPSVVRDMLEEGLDDLAPKIQEVAEELVPVDTGALKDSISTDVEGLTLTLSANTDYASEVNGRDPFLLVDEKDAKQELQDYFQQAVVKAVTEAAK